MQYKKCQNPAAPPMPQSSSLNLSGKYDGSLCWPKCENPNKVRMEDLPHASHYLSKIFELHWVSILILRIGKQISDLWTQDNYR